MKPKFQISVATPTGTALRVRPIFVNNYLLQDPDKLGRRRQGEENSCEEFGFSHVLWKLLPTRTNTDQFISK